MSLACGCICQAAETFATHPNHLLYSRGLHVTLASVCHTNSTQLGLCTAAPLSARKADTISLAMISCLLMLCDVGSFGKTSLTVEASWHLSSVICLPVPKVHDCLLGLTFLHILYCIIGEGDRQGGKVHDRLELCVPNEYLSWMTFSPSQRSS